MTKDIKLKAKVRDNEKEKGNKVRAEGMIPAVVYGSGSDNVSLKISRKDFEDVFAQAGESHLINLEIADKEPVKVIIKEVQVNPIKNNIIHADFYKVDMKNKITTEIPLHFIGEAKAVKELGGTLVKNFDGVEVKCLPSDLIDFIEVDLSALNTFQDAIRVKDLKVPGGMEILHEAEEIVALAIETKEEVIPTAAPAETEVKPAEEKKEEEKKEGEE